MIDLAIQTKRRLYHYGLFVKMTQCFVKNIFVSKLIPETSEIGKTVHSINMNYMRDLHSEVTRIETKETLKGHGKNRAIELFAKKSPTIIATSIMLKAIFPIALTTKHAFVIPTISLLESSRSGPTIEQSFEIAELYTRRNNSLKVKN